MGTPEFAVASLDALVKHNYNIVAVVTAPDKPAGRGQVLKESAVKKYAITKNLKVLQPANLKDEIFIEELKALNADLQIVVAFRMLPKVVWNMPALGTYNLHASLLPKYRGAAPINWAIMKGEKTTGVTCFKLEQEIDTGNILFQESVAIGENTTAGELHDALMEKGAELMVRTVKAIETHAATGKPLPFKEQIDAEATLAPKLNRDTCRINWEANGEDLHNLIRGLSPSPCAFTQLIRKGQQPLVLKIFRATFKPQQHHETNGTLLTDKSNYLRIYCKGGLLEIEELQLEGKKRMKTKEFLNGFKLDSEIMVG